MKIKAIHTKFLKSKCILEPVFWPKETGLQFRVIEGDDEGSFFTSKESDFTFEGFAKFKLFSIKIAYWLSAVAHRYCFHIWPHKIKLFFFRDKSKDGFLDF